MSEILEVSTLEDRSWTSATHVVRKQSPRYRRRAFCADQGCEREDSNSAEPLADPQDILERQLLETGQRWVSCACFWYWRRRYQAKQLNADVVRWQTVS